MAAPYAGERECRVTSMPATCSGRLFLPVMCWAAFSLPSTTLPAHSFVAVVMERLACDAPDFVRDKGCKMPQVRRGSRFDRLSGGLRHLMRMPQPYG